MPKTLKLNYFLVRIYREDGTELATRCERASDPRTACKMAYGVVYDRPDDTCRYVILPSLPRNMSRKALDAICSKTDNWLPIPPLPADPRMPTVKVPPKSEFEKAEAKAKAEALGRAAEKLKEAHRRGPAYDKAPKPTEADLDYAYGVHGGSKIGGKIDASLDKNLTGAKFGGKVEEKPNGTARYTLVHKDGTSYDFHCDGETVVVVSTGPKFGGTTFELTPDKARYLANRLKDQGYSPF